MKRNRCESIAWKVTSTGGDLNGLQTSPLEWEEVRAEVTIANDIDQRIGDETGFGEE